MEDQQWICSLLCRHGAHVELSPRAKMNEAVRWKATYQVEYLPYVLDRLTISLAEAYSVLSAEAHLSLLLMPVLCHA